MIYEARITIGPAEERQIFPTRERAMQWLAEMAELARTDALTRMRGMPVSKIGIRTLKDHEVPQGAIPWDVTQDWETERR